MRHLLTSLHGKSILHQDDFYDSLNEKKIFITMSNTSFPDISYFRYFYNHSMCMFYKKLVVTHEVFQTQHYKLQIVVLKCIYIHD